MRRGRRSLICGIIGIGGIDGERYLGRGVGHRRNGRDLVVDEDVSDSQVMFAITVAGFSQRSYVSKSAWTDG